LLLQADFVRELKLEVLSKTLSVFLKLLHTLRVWEIILRPGRLRCIRGDAQPLKTCIARLLLDAHRLVVETDSVEHHEAADIAMIQEVIHFRRRCMTQMVLKETLRSHTEDHKKLLSLVGGGRYGTKSKQLKPSPAGEQSRATASSRICHTAL